MQAANRKRVPTACPLHITAKPHPEDNTMHVSSQEIQAWCEALRVGREAAPDLVLSNYLDAIPSLDTLEDLRRGAPGLGGDVVRLRPRPGKAGSLTCQGRQAARSRPRMRGAAGDRLAGRNVNDH